MKLFFACLLFFGISSSAYAQVPNLVSQESLLDIDHIEDPALLQAFYGSMAGFPHTYEFVVTETLELYTQILLPDIDSSKNNISAIIIKNAPRGGRVTEIARLEAKTAEWKKDFKPSGGDTYRNGPEFRTTLQSGTYRIEVHTPDNLEKYVLVVGTRDEMTIGYFELIGRIASVKAFFEKSPVRIIESVYVYVPAILSIVIGSGVYYWWRRRRRLEEQIN